MISLFLIPLLLLPMTFQLLWARRLEEWMRKIGWLVTVWVPPVGVLGGIFSSILVTNLQFALGYAFALFFPLLLGVWLWVPFVSQSRAEMIAQKFIRSQSRDGWVFTTSTELKGQIWDVCGYWVNTPNSTRHYFWVKVHSKCGNVTAC